MAGPVDEFREAVLGATERQFDQLTGRQGVEPASASLDPINPMGAGPDLDEATIGAPTGYSGGVTVVPGVYGISTYGGGDVYTAS